MRRFYLFVLGIILFLAGIYMYVSAKYLSPYEFEITDKIVCCMLEVIGFTFSIICVLINAKNNGEEK